MHKLAVAALVCVSLVFAALRPALAQEVRERVDMDVVKKIKDEAMNRSQAMTTISYLTDVHGPRLTASPQIKQAAEWTKSKLAEWKLENVHLEPWGPFGRGWSLDRFSVNMVTPNYAPLIAYPKAWSPSTQKVVRGKPIYLDAKTEKDLDQYRGKLHKAIVLLTPPREVKALFDPPAQRQSDSVLLGLANGDSALRRPSRTDANSPAARADAAANPTDPAVATTEAKPETAPGGTPEQRAGFALLASKWRLVHEEGAAVVLEPGRGDGGTVFVSAATLPSARGATGADGAGRAPGGGPRPGDNPGQRGPRAWSPEAPEIVPQVVMAVEQYNRLVRLLEFGTPLEIEVDVLTRYHADDLMSFNVIAEIPGSDLKDEIVMLGGHFDSWHSGTGATDNAVGCGVALEAVRILQAIGVKPRRTIRIALWTGEEQGLLGSRAYVTDHFGRTIGNESRSASGSAASGTPAPEAPKDAATTEIAAKDAAQPAADARPAATAPSGGPTRYELKPEHEKFSAYFNLDNGGGKIRGIYLQRNEAVRGLFRTWLAPFADMGASTISVSNTGGTDHLSFDRVGLPGFQFIQDPLEYGTRTHHSSMDVFDRLIADDVKQASAIMASFVYNAAMRDEKLPRKPLEGEVVSPAEATAAATPAAAGPAAAAATAASAETK